MDEETKDSDEKKSGDEAVDEETKDSDEKKDEAVENEHET